MTSALELLELSTKTLDKQEALTLAKEAVKQERNSPQPEIKVDLMLNLVRQLKRCEEYTEALAVLNLLLKLDSSPNIRILQAEIYEADKKYIEAVSYYQMALDVNKDVKDKASILNCIGVVHMHQKQHKKAFQAFRESYGYCQTSQLAFKLAICHYLMGDIDKSVTMLFEVYTENEMYTLISLLQPHQPDIVDQLLNRSEGLLHFKLQVFQACQSILNGDDAEPLLLQLEKIPPDEEQHQHVSNILAQIYYFKGEYQKAGKLADPFLMQVIQFKQTGKASFQDLPRTAAAKFNQGLVLKSLKKLKEARDIFQELQRENKVDQEVLWQLADCQEDPRLQLLYFNKLLPVAPTNVQLHCKLAKLQDSNKPKAIYHCKEALRFDPCSLDAILSLGQIYEKQNQFQQAAQLYERAYVLRPKTKLFLDQALALYTKSGNVDRAQQLQQFGQTIQAQVGK